MEPLLCWPETPAIEIVRALDIAGFPWVPVDPENAVGQTYSGAIVDASDDPEGAFGALRLLRRADVDISPLMLVIGGAALAELETRHEQFEDFIVAPFHPSEFDARIRHLLSRVGIGDTMESVVYGSLELNLETYQAVIDGQPLDLTYMEYELLKFLAQNPGRVFTRETLLSRVWGYEYYGGARTVDVHIRRLRAKLGEEHAALISTVRSVGYRFGESRWS